MTPELRAGGTDLSERRRSGISTGPLLDIGHRVELAGVVREADGTRIGALVPIDTIATDPDLRQGYPALAYAAGDLATPQIRRVGTVGGNLLQHNRCWYYRNPADTGCLKRGGDTCPARTGNHRFHALFDLGPCVSVHPSTLGAALLAYGALVTTDRRGPIPVADLFGDGTDGRRDHRLAAGELLQAIHLPPPVPGEGGGYVRAIGRTHAEWPLTEVVARLGVHDGRIVWVAVAVGGVAPVPLRLGVVEEALTGAPATADAVERAATHATAGAAPLPQTRFKAPLLVGTVAEALDRALADLS